MNSIRRACTAALLLNLTMGGTIMGAPLTWYVSPEGSDDWSGTLATPNADRTDGPFASLRAARDASRSKPGKPRTIALSEGRFYLEEPLELNAADRGLTIQGAGQGKTVVYGGRRLTGWKKAGETFWVADLPEDLPDWSFRVLVVNDRMQDRARYPEEGYLEHETTFPVRWMSTAGGGWERKPTMKEYTTMVYKAGDIPADMRIQNAEVTVSHMWDESTLAVASNDPATHTLVFQERGAHPPGAFNVKRYAIWNTREGMTHPGQWYLDKVEHRVYYWPREGDDMASAIVVAPRTVKIIELEGGNEDTRAETITLRAFTLSAGDAPLSDAGFGGSRWPGVIHADGAADVQIEDVEVTNSGVWGIRGSAMQVRNCHLHDLGGGGVKYWGGARIEGNHIHDIGLVSANCIGVMGGGAKSVVRRNVIHDTPYSGMCIGGTETLIEENEFYRCMLVHHDGAAIYMGGGQKCIIRRNLARDMVQKGSGYGVSAYYLDEKCRDCVVAENVAIDIPHPAQNHMTLNCELRDNVFISSGDMKIAFARCSGHKVVGNTFHLEGKLNVVEPDAITEWQNNLIFTRNDAGGTITEDLPRAPFVPREKPRYMKPAPADNPPAADGKMGDGEWPSGGTSLAERPSQRSVRGAPTSVKILADDRNLYILVNVVSMFPKQRKMGTDWGVDEGVELVLEGRKDKKQQLYVLRGFTDGTMHPAQVPGTDASESAEFAKQVSYGAGVEDRIWRSEWAIPLAALGLATGEKTVLPFNLTAYRSEDDVFAQYAGTLGDTWDLKLGGRLMLNWSSPDADRHPVLEATWTETPPTAPEWPGETVKMAQTPSAVPLQTKPGTANVVQCDNTLYVRVRIPTPSVTGGHAWRSDDGAEVCIRGATASGTAVTWVIHGFADGTSEVSDEAGAPPDACKELQPKIAFEAHVDKDGWTAQWALPLPLLRVDTKKPVPFNLGAFRSSDRQWINWVGTSGPTWKLENAGLLKLR